MAFTESVYEKFSKDIILLSIIISIKLLAPPIFQSWSA